MPEETHIYSLLAEVNGGIVIHDVDLRDGRFRWMGKTYGVLEDSFCHYDQIKLGNGSIVGLELQFLYGDHNVDRVCSAFPNWALRTSSCSVRIDLVSPFERAMQESTQGFGQLRMSEEDGQIIVDLIRFEGSRFTGSIRSEIEHID